MYCFWRGQLSGHVSPPLPRPPSASTAAKTRTVSGPPVSFASNFPIIASLTLNVTGWEVYHRPPDRGQLVPEGSNTFRWTGNSYGHNSNWYGYATTGHPGGHPALYEKQYHLTNDQSRQVLIADMGILFMHGLTGHGTCRPARTLASGIVMHRFRPAHGWSPMASAPRRLNVTSVSRRSRYVPSSRSLMSRSKSTATPPNTFSIRIGRSCSRDRHPPRPLAHPLPLPPGSPAGRHFSQALRPPPPVDWVPDPGGPKTQ